MIKIQSERLEMRSIALEDAAKMFAYRSDALTNQFQGWVPKKVNDVCNFITNKVSPIYNAEDTWHQLVIIIADTKELIGDIGIHFIGLENNQVEIGYTLDKNFQGKGYATEALSKIIDQLFFELNKHRITASIDPGNIKSINLVERLGFRKEAHFRESVYINGEWTDDCVYAILKNEWKNKQPF